MAMEGWVEQRIEQGEQRLWEKRYIATTVYEVFIHASKPAEVGVDALARFFIKDIITTVTLPSEPVFKLVTAAVIYEFRCNSMEDAKNWAAQVSNARKNQLRDLRHSRISRVPAPLSQALLRAPTSHGSHRVMADTEPVPCVIHTSASERRPSAELSSVLAQQLDQWREDMQRSTAEKNKMEKEILQLREQSKLVTQLRQLLEKSANELRSQGETLEQYEANEIELETEILLQRQEIDALQMEVQRIKETQGMQEANPETELQIRHLREAKEQLTKQLEAATRRNGEKDQMLAHQAAEIKALRDTSGSAPQLQASLRQKEEEFAAIKQRSLELTVQLEQARQASAGALAAQEQLKQRDAELMALRRQHSPSVSASAGSQALATELGAVRAKLAGVEEQMRVRDSEIAALRKKNSEVTAVAQNATSEAANVRNKLSALEQQLEAIRRERGGQGPAQQQALVSELRSRNAALEQQLEGSRQKDVEIVALRKRLEAVANAPPISPNSYAAEAAQLRAANAELTLRLTESEAVQEQLQAMLRKTATQLKAAVTSAEEQERLQAALDDTLRQLAIERSVVAKLEAQLRSKNRP